MIEDEPLNSVVNFENFEYALSPFIASLMASLATSTVEHALRSLHIGTGGKTFEHFQIALGRSILAFAAFANRSDKTLGHRRAQCGSNEERLAADIE